MTANVHLAALDVKKRLDSGRSAHEKKIRVGAYFDEWLGSVRPSLKATAYEGYEVNINAYIKPILGDRWLTDLTVPTLNAFYRHLLDQGRRKIDKNTAMYAFWKARRDERNGLGPPPTEIAKACGATIHAARAAASRYRRGRIPVEVSPGLSVKSVKNVHRVIHRALKDAVAWGYLFANPAEHVVRPRDPRRKRVIEQSPWTVEELGRWLKVALDDRSDGIWALVATTGMRRSELAGITQQNLDLDNQFLAIEDTRVAGPKTPTASQTRASGVSRSTRSR